MSFSLSAIFFNQYLEFGHNDCSCVINNSASSNKNKNKNEKVNNEIKSKIKLISSADTSSYKSKDLNLSIVAEAFNQKIQQYQNFEERVSKLDITRFQIFYSNALKLSQKIEIHNIKVESSRWLSFWGTLGKILTLGYFDLKKSYLYTAINVSNLNTIENSLTIEQKAEFVNNIFEKSKLEMNKFFSFLGDLYDPISKKNVFRLREKKNKKQVDENKEANKKESKSRINKFERILTKSSAKPEYASYTVEPHPAIMTEQSAKEWSTKGPTFYFNAGSVEGANKLRSETARFNLADLEDHSRVTGEGIYLINKQTLNDTIDTLSEHPEYIRVRILKTRCAQINLKRWMQFDKESLTPFTERIVDYMAQRFYLNWKTEVSKTGFQINMRQDFSYKLRNWMIREMFVRKGYDTIKNSTKDTSSNYWQVLDPQRLVIIEEKE